MPEVSKETSEELVDWIGEDGHTLAVLPRSEMRRRNLLHRVTATLVFHPDGRVFVHRRSPGKDVYPSLWDPFVGGTVISGESFEQNACREVSEELGVTEVPVYPLFEHRFRDSFTASLIRVFACVFGGPIRLQISEVSEGGWRTGEEVDGMADSGMVCPDSSQGWRLYLQQYGAGIVFARDVAPRLNPVGLAGKG